MAEATRVLGVDPGLERTGYGLVSVCGGSVDYIGCGVIRTDPGKPVPSRLLTIANGLREILAGHSPAHAVVERVFVNMNPGTSLKLGEARGAAIAAIGQAGIKIHELAAKEVKRAVTGDANAAKGLVEKMVRSILGLDSDFSPGADAFDALACAICFQLSSKIFLEQETVPPRAARAAGP